MGGYIPTGTITYDMDAEWGGSTSSNGFSPSSGVFTAGQEGWYLFLFGATSTGLLFTYDEVIIRINGYDGKNIKVPRHGKDQDVTGFYAWHLNVGDKVYAYNNNNNTLSSYSPITFMGMLLNEM